MNQTSYNYVQQKGDTSYQLHNEDVDEQGPTPTHIVFLIHGMGYNLAERGKFRKNMLRFSENICSCLFSDYKDSGLHLYIYPIEWGVDFHELDTVDKELNKVTLKSVPGARTLLNGCVADTYFYFTDYHRQKLIDILGDKINQGYQYCLDKFPNFDGDTGFIGHSMGGMIGYDLLAKPNPPSNCDDPLYHLAFPNLRRPNLNFEPSFLFTLGTPLSAMMIMRGLKQEHYQLPKSIMFRNIFHLNDPLAYRFEHWVDSAYQGIDPISIPSSQPPQGILPTLQSYLYRRPSSFGDIPLIGSAKSMFTNTSSSKSESSSIPCPSQSPELEFEIPHIPTTKNQEIRRTRSLVSLMNFNELRRSSISSVSQMNHLLNTNSTSQVLDNLSHKKIINPDQQSDPINRSQTASPLAKLAIHNPPIREDSGIESGDEEIDKGHTIRRTRSLVSLMNINELRRSSISSVSQMNHLFKINPLTNQESGNLSYKKKLNHHQRLDSINKSHTASPLAKLAMQNRQTSEDSGIESGGEASSSDWEDAPQTPSYSLGVRMKSKGEKKLRKESFTESVNGSLFKSSISHWTESTSQLLATRGEDEPLSLMLGGLTMGLGMFSTKNSIGDGVDSGIEDGEVARSFHQARVDHHSDSIQFQNENNEVATDLPRYDYATPTESIGNLSLEYLLGIRAHFNYWYNRDITHFFLSCFKELKVNRVDPSFYDPLD